MVVKAKKNIDLEVYNSEDEYIDYDDNDSQSGGDDSQDSLGDEDSTNLDIDPNDEIDLNEDDKYDPINEIDEPEDVNDPEDDIDNSGDVLSDKSEEDEFQEIDEIDEENPENFNSEFTTDTLESKACHYKNLDVDIILDEDDSNTYIKIQPMRIPDDERETGNIMTYYEMTRVIGTRAQQFNFSAPPLLEGIEGLHPAKMAYLELLRGMTPYIIRRHLPGKKYEDWKVSELVLIHEIKDNYFVPENFTFESK